MIITNPGTEVIYYKIYEDYFDFPRNRTSPHNLSRSYCKKLTDNSGIFFIEYDFYICDDFTKEPFFVYRIKNSFTFVVEDKDKDLVDLGIQRAMFRDEVLAFIKDNCMGHHLEDLDRLFSVYNTLDLITPYYES